MRSQIHYFSSFTLLTLLHFNMKTETVTLAIYTQLKQKVKLERFKVYESTTKTYTQKMCDVMQKSLGSFVENRCFDVFYVQSLIIPLTLTVKNGNALHVLSLRIKINTRKLQKINPFISGTQ